MNQTTQHKAADQVVIAGSLRNTLMISLVGIALVLATLLYIVVRSYAAQIAQSTQDRILSASVTSILDAAAIRNGQVNVELPYASFSILSTQADDRLVYAVHQDGVFLTGYDTLAFRPQQPGDMQFYNSEFDGSEIRVAVATRRLVGTNQTALISVSIGQTRESLDGVLREISQNAALLGFGFFVLMTALSLWLTTRAIAPMTALAQSVQRRGPADLRLVQSPVPAEMAPLVGSLNVFMQRLEQSLNKSEEFIAEAAHRVRTPLAIVRTHAETTLQRVDRAENRQSMRTMIRAIDESSRAAGQLLDHAMITFRADHLEKQPLDLSELVQELVRSMIPVADMKDIDLSVATPDELVFDGDAILLRNAMRNLIDNAMKYAPMETEVEIHLTADPVAFAVLDRGPGFPSEEIETLAARFARGSNSSGMIGSGLGLTIAEDVAIAHGGRLDLRNRKEGGACATLQF